MQSGESELTLIGQSPAIAEVRTAISLVADANTAVLISGESGTGKDVVARMIHNRSKRNGHPFIALNCAALPKDVIENELFGHELGAFTGALARKTGCFEMARGGTIFFDEIAEMPTETQAKLLRAIETKSVRRLGGGEEIHVDVRTLAATNKDIATALRAKELRDDLYYRFSVIEIVLPPLRERCEDIPLLIDHFLGHMAHLYRRQGVSFSEQAIELMRLYAWPGNVRELKNVVERCMVISRQQLLGADLLPERISLHHPSSASISIPMGVPMLEAEERFITATMASVGHNVSEAARVLGLSRRGLQKKLQRIGPSEAGDLIEE